MVLQIFGHIWIVKMFPDMPQNILDLARSCLVWMFLGKLDKPPSSEISTAQDCSLKSDMTCWRKQIFINKQVYINGVLTTKMLIGKQCCLIINMGMINLPICGVDSPDGSVDIPSYYEVKYRGTFNLQGQIFTQYHVSQIHSDSENLSSALQSLNPSSLKRYLSFSPPWKYNIKTFHLPERLKLSTSLKSIKV